LLSCILNVYAFLIIYQINYTLTFITYNNHNINSMSDKKIDKKICSQIRRNRKQGWTYEKLDKMFTNKCITEIISCSVGVCDCNCDVESLDAREDEPWKEEYVVKRLYLDLELKFTEMSNIMDCHSETAKKYVDNFDVCPVNSSERTSSTRVNKYLRIGAETNGDVEIK